VKKLNAKHLRFVLFVVFAAACVYAPLSIVWKYENTLRHGTLFKFRTAPVDPVDAFRGRYVTLSFADNFLPAEKPATAKDKDSYVPGGIQYVRFAPDAEGFAKPVEISRAPLAGDDVITAENTWWSSVELNRSPGWRLQYPFSRYYLPEDIAPMAEKLYLEANRRDNATSARGDRTPEEMRAEWQAEQKAREARKIPAYVAVRVRNGVGVIEELYLNGVPVREAVREKMHEQQQQTRQNNNDAR